MTPGARAEAGDDIEREVWELTTAEHVRARSRPSPTDERAAIELAYWGGYTYREVAAQLDQPEGTVKSRIRSGLQAAAPAPRRGRRSRRRRVMSDHRAAIDELSAPTRSTRSTTTSDDTSRTTWRTTPTPAPRSSSTVRSPPCSPERRTPAGRRCGIAIAGALDEPAARRPAHASPRCCRRHRRRRALAGGRRRCVAAAAVLVVGDRRRDVAGTRDAGRGRRRPAIERVRRRPGRRRGAGTPS